MFQIRDQACEGHAALWASWNWKDSYGTANWKNFEWKGTKGSEITPYTCVIYLNMCIYMNYYACNQQQLIEIVYL